GQRGSQGDTSPCIVRGRSPQKAATQWQLNQPGRLAVSPLQLGFNKRNGQLPLGRQRRRIQPFEQIEQPLHIPRAAGKNRARHVVAEVQPTAARAQQQRQYFVVVIQLLHRVGYPPVQS